MGALENEIQRLRDDIAGYDYYINAGINVQYFIEQKNITQARINELLNQSTPSSSSSSGSTSSEGSAPSNFFGGSTVTDVNVSNGVQTTTTTTTTNPTSGAVPSQSTFVAPVIQYTNPPEWFNPNLYEGTYGKDYVAIKNPDTGETMFASPESIKTYQEQKYEVAPSGAFGNFTLTSYTTKTSFSQPVSEPVTGISFGSVDLTTDLGKIRDELGANRFYSQYGSYLQDRGVNNFLSGFKGFTSNVVTGAGSFVESTGLTKAFPFFNTKFSSMTSVREEDLPILFGGAELVNPNPTSFAQLFKSLENKQFVWTNTQFGFVDKPTVLSGTPAELGKQLDAEALNTVNKIEANNRLALEQEQWNRLNPQGFFAYQQELAKTNALGLYPNSNPFWYDVGALVGNVASGQVLFPSISFTSLAQTPYVSKVSSQAFVRDVYPDDEFFYSDDFDEAIGIRESGTKAVPVASVKSTVYVTNPLDSSKDYTVNVLGKQIYKSAKKISGGGYLVTTGGFTSSPKSYFETSTIIKPSFSAPTTSWVFNYGDDFIEWTPTITPSSKLKDVFRVTSVSNVRSEFEPFTQYRSSGDLYKSGNILIFKGSTDAEVGINAWTYVNSRAVLPKPSDYQYEVFVNPTLGDKIDDTLNAFSKGLSIGKKSSFNAYGSTGSGVLSAEETATVFELGAQTSGGTMAGVDVSKGLFSQSVTKNLVATSKFSPLLGFSGGGGGGITTKTTSSIPVTKPVVFTNPSVNVISLPKNLVVSKQGNAIKPLVFASPKAKAFSGVGTGTNTIIEEVVVTKPVTKVNTITKTTLTFAPVSVTPFGFGNPNFTPRGIPFGVDLPKFGGGGLRYGDKGAYAGKKATQYTPNVYSIAMNIRAPKTPKQGLFSGGEIKPVIGKAPKPFKFGLPKVKKKLKWRMPKIL